MASIKGPCHFDGCNKPAVCKGLCNGHYTQQYKGVPLTPLRVRRTEAVSCSATSCEKRARMFKSGKPLCDAHHQRWLKYGDAEKKTKGLVVEVGMAMIQYAVSQRDRSECWTDWSELPCWEGLEGWGGAFRNGYPSLGRNSVLVMHRVMEVDGRPRPPAPNHYGLHSCDNPACWNPDHLRWGSHEENLTDRTGKQNYCCHCPHCNRES